MDVALRDMGLDNAMISAIHDMLEFIDPDTTDKPHQPSRAFLRDTKAMKSTPADIIVPEFLHPRGGHAWSEIRPDKSTPRGRQCFGRQWRAAGPEKEEGLKYLKMERRFGKLLKKFVLPENASKEKLSAVCENGVLTVTVEKSPPPQPKKPKVIEVMTSGSSGEHGGGGGGSSSQEVKTGNWHENEGSHGEAGIKQD